MNKYFQQKFTKKIENRNFQKENRDNFSESNDGIKWDYIIDGDYLREKIREVMKNGGNYANITGRE